MKDTRDMRDPAKVGQQYLALREKGVDIAVASSVPADPYENGPFISNDPAHHHSKTPQTVGDLDTGGGS